MPPRPSEANLSHNGHMKFTERELTVAVDELAQQLFAATRPKWKRKGVEEAWRELPAMQKYGHRTAVADIALPVLIALPERPTVGATPEFTEEEWSAAADSAFPDRDDQHKLAAVAMARAAVDLMPIRQDPDAIVIPDHL